jgi:hypothetical protein
MKTRAIVVAAVLSLVAITDADAQQVERKVVEIYRIAPGRHLEFLEFVARLDEANRKAGVVPRELYVHSDGASWDFMIIQPAAYPPGKAPLVDAALRELGLPQGAAFFIEFRRYVATHEDTFVSGPTTAADWLKTLKK